VSRLRVNAVLSHVGGDAFRWRNGDIDQTGSNDNDYHFRVWFQL
jgi:hypothetical protein